MESNSLEKSTNSADSNIFFKSFDDLTDYQNLWCGLIFLKTILIFPKNFLNFWFDTVEKQSIINLSSYRNKSYASVVLSDSKMTFLRKEDASFRPLLYWILYINWRSQSSNFCVYHISGVILLKPAAFLFLIFVKTTFVFPP